MYTTLYLNLIEFPLADDLNIDPYPAGYTDAIFQLKI